MARFLNGTNLLDRINTEVVFKNTNLLSINQLNAQIKLSEVWKSLNLQNYPTQWELVTNNEEFSARNLRSADKSLLKTVGRSKIAESTFINDAAKIWNEAPLEIKNCKSLFTAKKEIKKYIKTLPL